MKQIRSLITILVSCLGLLRAQAPYAISGTLVTARGTISNGTMIVANGRIKEIGVSPQIPNGAIVVKVDGAVLPGFIDLHNHLVWNVLPRWTLPSTVANRYEWQAMPEYVARLSGPESALIAAGSGCDMERYAEVKALLAGATSVVGSYRNECVRGLARNLDVYSGLYSDQINAEPLRYEIFPFEIGWEQAKIIRDGLGSHDLRAVIFHVGEGRDASASREFRMLRAQGLLRPGVSIIHGVTLREPDFREMSANGVGFIWSPRSNLELYGKTADLESAKAAGVTIALAPDWSPTGSSGILDELRTAYKWNREHGQIFSDLELLQMVSMNPARLAGVSDKIGALAPGLMADFIVLPRKGESLLDSDPASIRLVVVGGKPLLGDPEYMRQLQPGKNPEIITVCGQQKALDLAEETAGQSWTAITGRLQSALKSLGSSLAELSECR